MNHATAVQLARISVEDAIRKLGYADFTDEVYLTALMKKSAKALDRVATRLKVLHDYTIKVNHGRKTALADRAAKETPTASGLADSLAAEVQDGRSGTPSRGGA